LPDLRSLEQLVWAGALYALLSLDQIAVGQLMFSRPIVVGPILGWFLGDPVLGLLVGVIVELTWVHVIPVGHWPIDTTAMAGLSVAWTLRSLEPVRPVMVMAFFLAIPAGMLVRHMNVEFRRQLKRFIPRVEGKLLAGDAHAVTKAVFLGVALWFVMSWGAFMVLALLGRAAVHALFSASPPSVMTALDFVGRMLPLFAFAMVMNYFFVRERHLPWHQKPAK